MKKLIIFLFSIYIALVSFSGCADEKHNNTDLSSLDFVNVRWERDTEVCIEKIYFNADGSCGYFCSCGNPVNDSDLCEGYTYNSETQTIHYSYFETTSETVTEVKLISCDESTLVLDFNGKIRTFCKDNNNNTEYFNSQIEYNGKTYIYLETPLDIFYYDLTECEEHEEDDYVLIAHDKWELVYHNTDLYILSEQASQAIAYYADDKNYTWSVVVEDTDSEESFNIAVSLSDEDIAYIYNMDEAKRNNTLLFEDIEIFATLIKTSNDSLIEGRTSLAYNAGNWYWRSEIIDDSTDGWPEYVVPLTKSLSQQIVQ